MKTHGFGPFSQFYELLHTVLESVDSFEGISDELLHTVLGSVDSFEGISGLPENSWIWSFLAVL